MSDVNKPENADTVPKCPFDPEQYKTKVKVEINNEISVPTASFPWAIVQVYLGNLVRRNGWNSPDEYIKLIPSSTGNDGKNIPPQIWTVDKDDEQPWTPTQEDLMACDWELYGTLSFEVISAEGSWVADPAWGYANSIKPFGYLKITQNTTKIESFDSFCWIESSESNEKSFYWNIVSYADKDSYQNVGDLLNNKYLYITVDGKLYSFGQLGITDYGSYSYGIQIEGAEAQKVGNILKQTDVKKTFCLNWRDK
ncbi:MW1434 family type I TA system toxin [Xenorhabdus bovienii]|uniref:DUF2829 domain-containing protein n=1 Tax=Xenorhabdus bovienii str. Intermedium TaxID=1379677 RepID=A0A077QPC0_XENBV|nr:MW1434 family type I TA system toxin [Xenorhabdus bovienii]CDH34121.1 conserved hypothetical protein [Xenorhabdus bovienii str. Intermedium]